MGIGRDDNQTFDQRLLEYCVESLERGMFQGSILLYLGQRLPWLR